MAKWRVVYKRSMHDKKMRGYGTRDAFAFFKDDYLEPDYAAFIEYQEQGDQGWTVFCQILNNRYHTNFHLIDSDGKNLLEHPSTTLGINFFTLYLKDYNPSPYDFLCALGARKDLIDLYKK